MPNMRYCRFHNTLQDLHDCVDALDDEEDLSPEEADACENLIALCLRIANDYGDRIESH